MEDINFYIILVNLFITLFCYMIVPIIIFLTRKKLTKGQAKCIAIINSVIVCFLFIILCIIFEGKFTGVSAFVYGSINYWLLSKNIKKEEYKYPNEEDENETLQNLIEKLENENSKK